MIGYFAQFVQLFIAQQNQRPWEEPSVHAINSIFAVRTRAVGGIIVGTTTGAAKQP